MLSSSPVSAIVLIAIGAAVGIGIDRYWLMQDEAMMQVSESESALEHAAKHADPDYVCPMHADVVSKEPGSCPVCGMDLVAREPVTEPGMAMDLLPEVTVTPEFMHSFGVRTATVGRGPVSRRITALGRVSRMPQPKVTDVTPGLDGTITKISDKTIGDSVDKGEWLYSVDAPEWRSLQQSYLDASEKQHEDSRRQLRQRLQSLGMSNAAFAQLDQEGHVRQLFDITAPVAGTIVEWRTAEHEKVEAAARAITLGGVNRVPVIISLFEGQGAWIDRGQRVVFKVPTMPGTEFIGKVDRTDREINFSTRTLPVYAGFFTADPRLRYGMLVEAVIHASERKNVLRIPREALIRTGEGDRLIVAKGDGRFQPVSVVVGIESGDHVEVLSGVEEGQEVVVSGQFLIDSESSLTANFQRMEPRDDVR